MNKDTLYGRFNFMERDDGILQTLNLIDQKIQQEIVAKQGIVDFQQQELIRLQAEINERNNAISELNNKLTECRSHVEGNRQLINKLITDIDKLQQNLDWYKRTYESRSLLGVIKDKLKHFFR